MRIYTVYIYTGFQAEENLVSRNQKNVGEKQPLWTRQSDCKSALVL